VDGQELRQVLFVDDLKGTEEPGGIPRLLGCSSEESGSGRAEPKRARPRQGRIQVRQRRLAAAQPAHAAAGPGHARLQHHPHEPEPERQDRHHHAAHAAARQGLLTSDRRPSAGAKDQSALGASISCRSVSPSAVVRRVARPFPDIVTCSPSVLTNPRA